MGSKLELALGRARHAAIGAAVGAFVGGLINKNFASSGGAVGGLIGAAIGEKRVSADSFIKSVKERKADASEE
ncbi:hypothetical protein GCM10027435_21890 [Haloparvum alkalitolerans]|uniref:glycine zipper domain-containing protein n=1 Tax=Haloparvum alkalitolerans TaxID=1042953 RepID=UPI003CEE19EB